MNEPLQEKQTISTTHTASGHLLISDFIFALGDDFVIDQNTFRGRNAAKSLARAFDLKDETPLATWAIRANQILCTDTGCHVIKGLIKKEKTSFWYADITTVDDDLMVVLKDGRAVQLLGLPPPVKAKFASLLRTIHSREAYAALRPAVAEAVKNSTPSSGISVIVGIITAVILWNVLGGFHGFVIGYIVGHGVAFLIRKAVAPRRNMETGEPTTEQSLGADSENRAEDGTIPRAPQD